MKNLSFLLLIIVGLIACEPSVTQLSENIDKIENELKEMNTLDVEKVESLIAMYQKLIDKVENEKKPSLLEKKAKYHASLNQYDAALDVYVKIYNDYPAYDKRGEALFMQAFIYEVNQNDLPKAEALYQQYLNEFPEGDFAKDAQFSIDNLYLSPEELIQKFKEAEQTLEVQTDSII